jgi:hypothetical protein
VVAAVLPVGESTQTAPATTTEPNDLKLGGDTALIRVAAFLVGGGDDGDFEGELEEEVVRTQSGGGGLDVEEKLRQLDLYEQTKDPDGLTIGRTYWQLPGPEQALAALGQDILVLPPSRSLLPESLSPGESSQVKQPVAEPGGDALGPSEATVPLQRANGQHRHKPDAPARDAGTVSLAGASGLWGGAAGLRTTEPWNDELFPPTFPTGDAEPLLWIALALGGSASWLRLPPAIEEEPRRPCRVPGL